ncbi:immunity protein YezG family protein [Clostridium cagae]
MNSEIGRLEREIRWAYDKLGIVPEDEYEKVFLEEYLKEQGKNL